MTSNFKMNRAHLDVYMSFDMGQPWACERTPLEADPKETAFAWEGNYHPAPLRKCDPLVEN